MKVSKLLIFSFSLLSFGICFSMKKSLSLDDFIKINEEKKQAKKLEKEKNEKLPTPVSCISEGDMDFFFFAIKESLEKQEFEANLIHSILSSDKIYTEEKRKNLFKLVMASLDNYTTKEKKLELLNNNCLVDFNYGDALVVTPLELGLLSKNFEILELLLENGADIFKTNIKDEMLIKLLIGLNVNSEQEEENKLKIIKKILSSEEFKKLSKEKQIEIINMQYN